MGGGRVNKVQVAVTGVLLLGVGGAGAYVVTGGEVPVVDNPFA